MERVEAECRKCGWVFSTAAKTRTTCPGCRSAVTVRRDRWATDYGEGGESQGNAWMIVVGWVVGLALVAYGALRGKSSET
jgi:hypothetical protein